ncbi:MAG: RNA polymerase sigma factor [Vicinamibacterales bacterium]
MVPAHIRDVAFDRGDRTSTAADQDFDTLFAENYRMVYRTAYGVLGNGHDAEDVVQTVFMHLVHSPWSKALCANPGAYLYRAAVNASLDVVRSRKRQLRSGAAEQYEAQRALAPPAEAAEEMHRRLYGAISELSPGAAEILILRYVHNCSDAEIAKRLGTSRGTIAVSLFRSRARLRKLLRASLS